jgi:tRNA threonylcarbamoyladenosine biosynthesis protein TsaE
MFRGRETPSQMWGSRTTRGHEETVELGETLGRELKPGDIVFLRGPLGAGKSTLASGIGRALGVGRWKGSPTFTLVNEYRTDPPLVHLDLYRLTGADLEDLGLEEYLERGCALVVEWPERAEAELLELAQRQPLVVDIDIIGDEKRLVHAHRSPGRSREAAAG